MEALVPQFLAGMYPGKSFPIEFPGPHAEPIGWGFRGDGDAEATITVLNVGEEVGGILRITSGVASAVPVVVAASLHETMSEVNSELYFGRAWATPQGQEGDQMLAILQEIVPLAFIADTAGPSTQFLGTLVEAISHAAAKATQKVLTRCGGEVFVDPFAIIMSG